MWEVLASDLLQFFHHFLSGDNQMSMLDFHNLHGRHYDMHHMLHITMLFLLLVMKAPTKETLKCTFVSNSHSLPAFETLYSRQKFSDKFG
jgi:hypothetical protein